MDAGAGAQPGGLTLVNTRGTSLMGCGAVAAVVGIGFFFLAVGASTAIALIGVAIAVVGGIALAYAARENGRWEDLELVLSEWPLPMGTPVAAQLVRRAKRPVPDQSIAVTGDVICRETVRYQQGTSSRTDRETVCRIPISVTGEVSNGTFTAAFPLLVPLDQGAPTLNLEHNEIDWRLELDFAELSPLMRDVSFDLKVGGIVRPSTEDDTIQDTPRGAV